MGKKSFGTLLLEAPQAAASKIQRLQVLLFEDPDLHFLHRDWQWDDGTPTLCLHCKRDTQRTCQNEQLLDHASSPASTLASYSL